MALRMNPSTLRQDIDVCLANHDARNAKTLIDRLWRNEPTAATAAFVLSRYSKLEFEYHPVRVALLRSMTVEPLVPFLRAGGYALGLALNVKVGEFNAYTREILDLQSWLYAFAPQVVILAIQTRDVAPELWDRDADLMLSDRDALIQQTLHDLESWIAAFRVGSTAPLVVHSLDLPPFPSRGLLDAQSEAGQTEALRTINRHLVSIAQETPGVYVLDYDGVVARYGRSRWYDEGKWWTVRLPFRADAHSILADEWLRFVAPLSGKLFKVLVTDLDNTLWGGVLGEEGPEGLKTGAEFPGAAYQAVQRTLLDLERRGVLLAISSKNDERETVRVLETHPGLLVRPHHFACRRIDWRDKATHLREIAAELNVGLDTLAFLDDNPVERQWVRQHLPEVAVLDVSDDPLEFAAALRRHPGFERLAVSREDLERSGYYWAERERRAIARGVDNLENFYRSLDQEVTIARITNATLARAAQLVQKTNQFNLTTRRRSEAEIAAC